MTVEKAFQNMIVLDAVCGQKDFYDEEFRQAILTAERSLEGWKKVKEEILTIQKYDGNSFINISYLLENIINKHLQEVENADSHNP